MKNIILKITILVLACSVNVDIFCQASDDVAKAVAFEKLAMFISWPPAALNNDSSGMFIIAVLNNKPFGKNLEEVYKTHQIKNKNVQVVYFDKIKELGKCDLLFISNSSTDELKIILSSIHGKPILTIADKEGFAEAGCFINLYEFESKLRFEINQKGMQDAGFKIDYRLLRVSKVLNPVIE
jgi:hypothetical protein